jgi:hypothetical protein
MAQVPPPPHADGRKIFCDPNVESSDVPAEVTIGELSSPLTTILTGPEATSFDWANRRIKTSSRIIIVNATTDVMITEPMKFWFDFPYGLTPIWDYKYIYKSLKEVNKQINFGLNSENL